MDKFSERRQTSPRRQREAAPASSPAATDRVPPHNLDAEQGLLASCIIESGGEILNECIAQKINPDYFFTVPHQLIFRALIELQSASIPIDEISLCHALETGNALETAGGAAYVNALTNRIEVTAHARHWLKIVREKYFLRKLISTATRTVELAYQPGDDLGHLLNTVEQSFFEITNDRIASDSIQHVRTPVKEAEDLIRQLQESRNSITGVPTGFDELNKMCFGFHPGQMIVVAARPGMGKTSIALNFIEAALFKNRSATGGAAPPVPSLMFSLEMPSRELAMRLLCARASAGLEKIREGTLPKAKLADIVNAGAEYKDMPFYIDDQGGQTILEIRAKARRLVQQHKIGIIIIDYLQLINGTDNSLPREQQIAEASRSIKAMAKEFKLPIIALAQLNRKSEDENRAPRMSDLRESGSIEQDADMVLLIDKKRKGGKRTKNSESEDDSDEENGIDVVSRELIIAKQRNGPTGEVELLFRKSLARFESAHSHGHIS
ncbi:MAG: replicative DNA helicase [Puniceicoccales bacterium]|jgi:replicative DNA helicase|nr:replicative DNA helicase [Puniceicoccales bacterium]